MSESKAILLAGLAYGDEGKGATVDYLVRKHGAKAVVRYNGGAQAAHNVVTSDGRHHTFAQWGSGTFSPDVVTYLSKFMLFNPFNMIKEGEHLVELGVTDAFDRLYVDEDAPVITLFHRSANRLREMARGDKRHGSCGQGIGETMIDLIELGPLAIRVKDLRNRRVLTRKLEIVQERKLASLQEVVVSSRDLQDSGDWKFLQSAGSIPVMVDAYMDIRREFHVVDAGFLARLLKQGPVVFEGAQGVLLDQTYGFQPYSTWTDITYRNAETLLRETGYTGEVNKVGVLRGYATRHGAGPFVTESKDLTAEYPDLHNGTGNWQGGFRVGHFDLVAARYALEVIGGVDELALTCMDRVAKFDLIKMCVGYETSSHSDDLFEYQDGVATRIKVLSPTTEQHQTRLANELFKARPSNFQLGGMSEYLRVLSDDLRLPISSVSYGLTANDRQAATVALL